MATLEEFMAKTAAYIAKVQPENDRLANRVKQLESDLAKANEKIASAKSDFAKRATQAAGVLANRGLIDQNEVNTFVDKVAEDNNSVWEFVEKLASSVGADSLGDKSNEKLNTAATGDPWVDTFFHRTGSASIY